MNSLAQTATDVYNEAFDSGLRPDPLLTVSEWADRYRRLSGKSASEPGPYRTDRTTARLPPTTNVPTHWG